ncbi:MAG: hypothetical protein M3Q73_03915 [bacterium]|nr:hypothetical protein [bacterium]
MNKTALNGILLILFAIGGAWVLYQDHYEEVQQQPLLMGGAIIGLILVITSIAIRGMRANAKDRRMPPQDNGYTPENPVRTYLGINNKQLFVGGVVLSSIGLSLTFNTFVFLYIALAFVIVFSIVYRNKVVSDFKAVKVGDVPLMPEYSVEVFSWRSTVIIVGVLIVVAALFIYFNL